ncbi:peptidase family M49-domain-containing protein [Sphaerosporella brunnea]|uniref:Dipeptidyl peptidase 3 n=1 Tax=Sphaerosporella brunnea TaxID=1250544 RepID=A0A5J5EWE7_9PEZI|nr:peptidase family M49-domain-containing protein [Sphaerosporella brunnea]
MSHSGSPPSHLLADSPPTICKLVIAPHFAALTDEEKLYAHHISRASFLGTRIVLRQVSPESEGIYDLIIATYEAVKGNWKKLSEETGVNEQNVRYWVEYAAQFLGNLGNYKSFGDQKFVPRIPREELEAIMRYEPGLNQRFNMVADAMYSYLPESIALLGYPEQGHISQYYPASPTITKEEIAKVHEATASEFSPENTRLVKSGTMGSNGQLKETYTLLVASAEKNHSGKTFELDGKPAILQTSGDHSNEMEKIVKECDAAVETALNETQKNMFQEYSKSFQTGSIEAHRQAQKHWVQDKGPKVECNIGFIETYRDPHGVRAEWEGFVAMVNQDQTKKFGELVARAGEFIPRLPWGKEFEKDAFLKPDFTSLEVLSFCTSGIPAGINIPNYDDIRQTFGFKNVSLGNILSAKAPNEPITFIKESDLKLYESLKGAAFEVQVGIHELLGHGTGKLLQEVEKGKFNFDTQNPPVSPVTGEEVKTWYGVGETWGGVFGSIAASYEECRAECVAMYLGGEKDLLKIFGFGDDTEKKADDVLYVEYLQMARAGLLALEFWDPRYKKWGQGHMQARFSILQTMLQAGESFIKLESSGGNHDDLVISLNRDQIRSHGIPAIGKYLQKLHVFKSTADFAAGKKLYDEICTVNEDMAKYREAVMRKKLPRKQFVQANTVLTPEGKVELKEYEPTLEGLIQSYVERDV